MVMFSMVASSVSARKGCSPAVEHVQQRAEREDVARADRWRARASCSGERYGVFPLTLAGDARVVQAPFDLRDAEVDDLHEAVERR